MNMVDDIDFASYLYPHALETIQHLWSFGTVAILSDGDTVFQPLKIHNSGLEEAVHSNVIITIHKELEMKKVFDRFPADTYVVVDDKPRILAVFERRCPTLYTTVLVLQGHYGVEGQYTPRPDITIRRIGDLKRFGKRRFLEEARKHLVASRK